jgi:class 3 adenylate cyclase
VTDERRLVTVLFADVVGSTGMGEELDPEDLRALLWRYFAISREVVEAHGGTVEKYIGDAVMAVFGLPRAHDDDPVRALHAALQLRDRVRDDPMLGDRLPIRMGVNTGDVVAAREAAGGADFLVTGDAINAGARLQQAAEPWSILVGERTARGARGRFELGPARQIEAKGKPGGVTARELRGVAARARAQPRTPFVGRDADLAQLELLAARSFEERTPYLVTVIAPAGTGKTRLLEEFLARLPGHHAGVQVAVAQCLPYGQRLTYWPLRALLFQLLALEEDSDAEHVRSTLNSWLIGHDVSDPEPIVGLVAATIGAGELESTDRAALLAAWRMVIESAALAQPLVLVIEDLHWSSDSLLDLLEYILQPRADAPILMIALSRPELLDRRPTWGGGRRNHLSLALAPLPDRSVEELVRSLLEGASPDVVDGVVRRAEGNPFYAGEIVQSVIERAGTLEDMDRIEEAVNTLPDTVQATVLARLDLLEPSQREVLKVGSVFGRSFRASGIGAVAPDLAEVAPAACEELAERDLIRPSGVDGYVFRHILIREVAYQTLPRAERARLHAAAARWLEQRRADDDGMAELIAFHYREAATLAKASARGLDDETRSKAEEWLERAAQVARSGAATLETLRHLHGAVEFADDERLPYLYEQLGQADQSGRDRTRSFERARELAAEQGLLPTVRLRIGAQLQLVYLREVGSVSTRPSREYLDQLRAENAALAMEVDDQRVLAMYEIAESFLPYWETDLLGADEQPPSRSEVEAAEVVAQRGLDRAEEVGDLRLASIALDSLGALAQDHGDWRRALALNERRLRYDTTKVDLAELVDAYAMVVWNNTVLGRLDEADRVGSAGMALLQPGQIPAWALHLCAWRSVGLRLAGEWDRGLEVMARGRQLWLEAGRPSAGYAVRGFAAACDIARARRDEDRLEQYLAIVEEIESQFPARDLRRGLRYAKRDMDWIAEAAGSDLWTNVRRPELRANVIDVAVSAGITLPAGTMRDLASWSIEHGLLIQAGQATRALAMASGDPSHLDGAVELFRACGARPALGRSLVERGMMTGNAADVGSGRAILESLGDVEQLDRYDQLAHG